MEQKIKLGVIGLSEGNGHPYSWSAIFNGYNHNEMSKCSFPAIPAYLNKQKFPKDGLGHLATVTHIWTQSLELSKNVSNASCIPNICSNLEDMIGEVQGVLLARDDGDNHLNMAMPFIEAGLPIFIDKPFALNLKDAKKMINHQKNENQIFTCSSLRFSEDLILTESEKNRLGTIEYVEAIIPKSWDTYAIHLLEPIISQISYRGELKDVFIKQVNKKRLALITWQNLVANVKTMDAVDCPIEILFYGKNSYVKKTFKDSYQCFKSSLKEFILVGFYKKRNILRQETLELVEILERGRI